MLRGCFTALVTPMFSDGSIDYNGLVNLLEWQISSGIDGLVVNGTTAESATLSLTEKLTLIKLVIKINQNRVKIIVGCGTISTHETIEFIQEINQIDGIDCLMCRTPYYVKPTQQGMYLHFSQIAMVSKLPIMLYNVPTRTACDLSDDTILRLANDCPNIVAIKDVTGDMTRCSYLMAHKPDNFMLFSGHDETALAYMMLGGNGLISVASNLRPKLFSKLTKTALNGDYAVARKLNQQLIDLCRICFCESNPIPLKWGLWFEQHLTTAHLRLPLTVLSIEHHERMKQILTKLKE